MSTADTLQVEERDDRVVVSLHRPQARNAINAQMISELHDVCELLERDPRLLLLTGANGHFAGGADIGELRARGSEEALQGINSRLHRRLPAQHTRPAVRAPGLVAREGRSRRTRPQDRAGFPCVGQLIKEPR